MRRIDDRETPVSHDHAAVRRDPEARGGRPATAHRVADTLHGVELGFDPVSERIRGGNSTHLAANVSRSTMKRSSTRREFTPGHGLLRRTGDRRAFDRSLESPEALRGA